MLARDAHAQYAHLMGVLKSGSREDLEAEARSVNDFPHGLDGFLGRRWIRNAIDCGSRLSIDWMIGRGVDLQFCDEEGYTVLHSALDRERDDRHEILKKLLAAGAPVNARGLNDWTPLHMAAVREDIPALEILVSNGADPAAKTNIDDYATPVEEARSLGRRKSVEFLEGRQRPGTRG